jgi:hypothetical protein
MRSPSEIVNETFRKSGAVPNRFDSSWALMIGAKSVQPLLKVVIEPGAKWGSPEVQGKAGRAMQKQSPRIIW